MDRQVSSLLEMASGYLIAPNLSDRVAQQLVEGQVNRYSEPWRFYHVVAHLGDVTKFLVDNVARLRNPRVTLWRAMYHDAIYVPQAPGGVNEELSAQLAVSELRPYLDYEETTVIGSGIRKTANHISNAEDEDMAYFLDSDLLILGAPEEEFSAYDTNIRREYKHVNKETYKRERAKILKSFYDREYIYATDLAREQCESQAKSNLARALDRLVA